jgi:glucosamine 6-phosphate synthetase-like amidotransferase/phosphosugar isomerase protein
MCGIVGYVGPKNVVPVIIEGLRRLEYRGCDVDQPRNLAKSLTVD